MEEIDSFDTTNRKKIIAIHKLAYKGPEYFGLTIRKLRELHGWKVYELAKKVGIDPVYLTQIEKHNRSPSDGVIERITIALDDPFLFKVFVKNRYPKVYEAIKTIDFFSDKEAEDLAEQDIDNILPEEILERLKRWEKIETVAKRQNLSYKN